MSEKHPGQKIFLDAEAPLPFSQRLWMTLPDKHTAEVDGNNVSLSGVTMRPIASRGFMGNNNFE